MTIPLLPCLKRAQSEREFRVVWQAASSTARSRQFTPICLAIHPSSIYFSIRSGLFSEESAAEPPLDSWHLNCVTKECRFLIRLLAGTPLDKKESMNRTTRYMSLAILLTFTVGQVQYGYTSYFCTMLNAFLPSPAAAATIHNQEMNNGACSACQGVTETVSGAQNLEPNCLRIVSIQKDVVASFLGTTSINLHNTVSVAFVMPQMSFSRTNVQGRSTVSPESPPPLDLPTIHSNLRI